MPSKDLLQKRVGKYYLGRTIGEGTYSKVKYGQHVETGEAVAVKVLDKEHLIGTGMVEQIKREITILKQIHHPNIVDLKEVMASKDKIFMVMELVTGGELFDQIVAEGPKKEHIARPLFMQLLAGLEHCHQQGVFHRDLKPENVLLSSDGTVKLSDFGLGALPDSVRENGLLMTTCGTPNYVAPEVLAKKGYEGGPADVWSLGVVLFVVLAGCLPFDKDDLPSLFQEISSARYQVPPWLSRDAKSILSRMLDPNPKTRATLEELWEHPWVRAGPHATRIPNSENLTAGVVDDILQETVCPQLVAVAKKKGTGKVHGASPERRLNAFELIKPGMDISAIFEARDDVVMRRTRFTSRAQPACILKSVEVATVAIGGRVERRGDHKLRLTIPNRKGPLAVNVEVFEVLPGKHITDLSKVSGNTVEFYKWYGDLTRAVGPLVAQGAAARSAASSAGSSGGLGMGSPGRRLNAFELLNCCSALNVNGLFDAGEDEGARHVQFSSQKSQEEILEAIDEAVKSLGGIAGRQGESKLQLQVPLEGNGVGRQLVAGVQLIELRPGVQVVKISKERGASMEFFKFYGQLASLVRPIMMKKVPHPSSNPLTQSSSTSIDTQAEHGVSIPLAFSPRSTSESSSGALSHVDVASPSGSMDLLGASSGSHAMLSPPASPLAAGMASNLTGSIAVGEATTWRAGRQPMVAAPGMDPPTLLPAAKSGSSEVMQGVAGDAQQQQQVQQQEVQRVSTAGAQQ